MRNLMKCTNQTSLHNVARYTVLRLQQMGISISPLKLQKLLYYIQAWHLVYFDKQSLFDEEPEAWVNGPVYRKIYDEFKNLGIYEQITPKYLGLDEITLTKEVERLHVEMNLIQEQWRFIEAVYAHYGVMNHDKLVMLTHSERPWNEARKEILPFEYSENKISKESMYIYYKSLLKQKK